MLQTSTATNGKATPAAVVMGGQNAAYTHIPSFPCALGATDQRGKKVLPTFRQAGTPQLLKKHVKNETAMWRDLTELFAVANLGGQFTLIIKERSKGTPHTQGVTIRTPAQSGALLQLHYGSNADSIEAIVVAPNNKRDAIEFSELLKKARDKIKNESEQEKLVRRAQYDVGGFGFFRTDALKLRAQESSDVAIPAMAEQPAPIPVAPVASVTLLPAPAAAASPVSPPARSLEPRLAFYENETAMELLLEALLKSATTNGIVARASCTQALSGLVQGGNATGAVLRGIINRGYLLVTEADENQLRFGRSWLEAWQKKCGTATTAPINLASLTQIDETVDAESALKKERSAADEKARNARAEIEKLDAEKSRIETLVGQHKTVLAAADSEVRRIDAELADPKYDEARKSVEMIQKLMQKKVS